jgi:hypothetical protein
MNWCIQVSKHKFIEIEANVWKENCKIFQFNIDWTQKCDHAGFSIDLEFFELAFSFTIYDHRHWDYDTKNWCKYEPVDEE